MVAYQEQLFKEANGRIDALQASAQQVLIGTGLAALVCGSLFAWYLTRSITRPLAHAVALAEQVASRDLTADIQVSSRDEVGHLLRSLRGVWDEDAVDELDHALQAAARARDDGADDELVLAAALHDLAHSPEFGDIAPQHHDRIAREWLTPRFGARVGWLG